MPRRLRTAQTLLPIFPSDASPINEIISFCKRDGSIYYFHGCLPVFLHAENDLKAFRLFASQLVVNETCTQAEIGFAGRGGFHGVGARQVRGAD